MDNHLLDTRQNQRKVSLEPCGFASRLNHEENNQLMAKLEPCGFVLGLDQEENNQPAVLVQGSDTPGARTLQNSIGMKTIYWLKYYR